MNKDQIRDMADKIAGVIAGETGSGDLNGLRQSIDQINLRLDKIETAAAAKATPNPLAAHPSQNRFEIAEAIVDRLFDKSSSEKACAFEPNGKPCDHCSMCSSLGF